MTGYAGKITLIEDWENSLPETDAQWAEDTKTESLHLKTDEELNQMLSNLEQQLPVMEREWDWAVRYPDSIRKEAEEKSGMTDSAELDELVADTRDHYVYKMKKINQSIVRIQKERSLRAAGIVARGE